MTRRPFIPRRMPRTVWLIAATSTVLMSGFGMIVPLIPVYAKQLGATATELGLLMAGLFAGRLLAQGIESRHLRDKASIVDICRKHVLR